MMVFTKKTTLFVALILMAYGSIAQSLTTGSVHFPLQKIYLPNGYTFIIWCINERSCLVWF
jgi:hypothetical protein